VIPKLHVVTDDGILRHDGFLPMARAVLDAGGPDLALHIRGPRTDGSRLFELVDALAAPARASGAALLVNDRVDLALCADLAGIHLGQRSLPADVARGLAGPGRLLGLSVHGADEVPADAEEVLDYLLVGTIFPSGSHPDGTPGGMERIQVVGEATSLPLVAIGGLPPPRVGEVLQAGAHGVAVLGAVWKAKDAAAAVGDFVAALAGEL